VTQGARQQNRRIGGMSVRAAAWLAWSVWALSLPFAAFSGGVLGFLSASARIFSSLATIVLFALLALTYTTFGALVASRRPENPIGWIFCAGGLILSVTVCAENYAEYALNASTGSLPGVPYAAWIASWALGPGLALVATMLFLLFPDGKLLSRELGFVAWTAVVASVVVALGDSLGRSNLGTVYGSMGNPFAVEGAVGNFLRMLGGLGVIVLLLCFLASVAALFVRLRQARGVERQQIKWFAYAAAVMGTGPLVMFMLGGGYSALEELMWHLGYFVGILGFALLPIATAIAILKYRLYDIDRIINSTLVYGALTVTLVGVYVGSVLSIQYAFRGLAGSGSQLAIVASTLLIAALFNPLRRRMQSFIDRRFYRRKYDAARTLEAFSAKLRNDTDLDALSEDLVDVVRETIQPAHVSVWLRPDPAHKGGSRHTLAGDGR
jgi:hypothetical protein